MKFSASVSPGLLLLLCLPLTGCDEVKTTLDKRDKGNARMEVLIAENTDLEHKLTALKQMAPPNVVSAQIAFFEADKAGKDLEYFSLQLDKALKSFEETDASVKAMEAELVALRQIPRP